MSLAGYFCLCASSVFILGFVYKSSCVHAEKLASILSHCTVLNWSRVQTMNTLPIVNWSRVQTMNTLPIVLYSTGQGFRL